MIGLKLTISLWLILISTVAKSEAPPKRIEAIFFDKSQVQKLFLYPGRSTLVDFPCPVTRAVSGPAGDVKVTIGATDASELDIWLKSGASQATNLTVRCGREVFVFDVIPSKATHQEYIEIVGAYGAPETAGETQSSQASTTEPYKKLRMLDSSQNHLAAKKTPPPYSFTKSDTSQTVTR